MATDRWIDPNQNGDPWTTASDWSTGRVPTSTSNVVVAKGNPIVEAPFTVASITDSSAITFIDAGLSTVTGTVDVTRNGLLTFDPPGPEPDGGSSLTIDGALTNAGAISVGTGPNASGFTLDAPDTLTAASINNTGGTLALWGGPSVLAEVVVNGAASLGTKAGYLEGTVTLSGDAELEFASGSITTIAANSQLSLTGDEADVDDAGGSANSALSGLKTVDGGLWLHSGAAVNTGALTVGAAGYVYVDTYPNDGGSALNVDGALTNDGSIALGPSEGSLSSSTGITAKSIVNKGSLAIDGAGANAVLTISGKASFGGGAGVLEGTVSLSGDALVTFGSSEITTLDGSLTMFGPSAAIDDAAGKTQNSALRGITSIGTSGGLDLEDASLTTTGALTNSGYLYLDNGYADGGSTLSVGKNITNEGTLEIGALNGDLSANSTITTTGVNNTGGRITLEGNSPYQALLDVNGAADLGAGAGQLDGIVDLQGDSAIEFASGALTSIESGGQLSFYGDEAFIEDANSLGSNSALNITMDDGDWSLYEGAVAATTNLTVGSTGTVYLSSNGTGGVSALSLSGTLDNGGTTWLDASGADATVTASTVDNAGGQIILQGSGSYQALLDVTTGPATLGATAGELAGDVSLSGSSAIEFASGALTTIDSGANLTVSSAQSFIEDSGSLGSNSALNVSMLDGAWNLEEGAIGATTGLTIGSTGGLGVDSEGAGGNSALTNSGTLTNDGGIDLSVGYDSTAATLTNSGALNNQGTIQLAGNGSGDNAALSVSGTTTNDGTFIVTDDDETLAGAVAGAGTFEIGSSTLQLDSSVSTGQTLSFSGADTLGLSLANEFSGTLTGFGAGDAIDAQNFKYGSTSIVFNPNAQGTGGALALTYGSLTANILMTGSYSTGDFQPAMDSGTGTLIKFV